MYIKDRNNGHTQTRKRLDQKIEDANSGVSGAQEPERSSSLYEASGGKTAHYLKKLNK